MSEQKTQTNNGARLSPYLQQQYLKAMGIEAWQFRQVSELPDASAENVSVASEQQLPSGPEQEQPIEKLSAAEQPVINEAQTLSEQSIGLDERISACKSCELHQQRKHTVVAEGSPTARFMFVMLAPASNAEVPGKLLNSASSELLTKMLNAISLQRNDIFLTSLLKCPLEPGRDARTTELICCEDFLREQVEQVKPELLITMGEKVAQHLLVNKKPLNDLRQATFQYQNVNIMAMHHPDDLVTSPELKRAAWQDLQQIQRDYNV